MVLLMSKQNRQAGHCVAELFQYFFASKCDMTNFELAWSFTRLGNSVPRESSLKEGVNTKDSCSNTRTYNTHATGCNTNHEIARSNHQGASAFCHC